MDVDIPPCSDVIAYVSSSLSNVVRGGVPVDLTAVVDGGRWSDDGGHGVASDPRWFVALLGRAENRCSVRLFLTI